MSKSPSPVPIPGAGFTRFLHAMLPSPLTYWLMGAMILLLDLLTGPFLSFPILFVIPVSLAAWFISGRLATVLAVMLPLGRALIAAFLDQPTPLLYIVANTAIRIAVLVFIAYLSRTGRRTRELEHKVAQLEGILPICMFCKRIRDKSQHWQQLESYISAHSEADFSHGICPECVQEHYGDILNKGRNA